MNTASILQLPLWPETAPGENGLADNEQVDTSARDFDVDPVTRISGVSRPSLTLYRPSPERATGAAALVLPGGGYRLLAWDKEGTEIAAWLNSIGIAAAVLKYRVPPRPGRPPHEAPLQDAQRAMRVLRSRGEEWGLDPERVGVIGFSAGAHLAATLSAQNDGASYSAMDAADGWPVLPRFALLLYPAYLVADPKAGTGLAEEVRLHPGTPPTFLLQTEDDHVGVENSLFYYLALKRAGVPGELHLYAAGGHGYGLRATPSPASDWPKLAAAWLRGLRPDLAR